MVAPAAADAARLDRGVRRPDPRRIANADATLVVVDPDLAPFLDPPSRATRRSFAARRARRRGRTLSADRCERPADDPDRSAILQFTSGSTADPKGVMLPHRCVIANIDAIAEAAGLDAPTTARVSWLPLYHDMGLIGLLMTPMLDRLRARARRAAGLPRRARRAGSSGSRSSAARSPRARTSPYALAAARAAPRRAASTCRAWRLALNGAEPVDPDAVEAFCAAGAPYGLDAKARVLACSAWPRRRSRSRSRSPARA